jgi:hypothetical protein
MLYEFLLPLTQYESGFNIFRYISFRAAGAAITSLLISFGPARPPPAAPADDPDRQWFF